MVQTTKLPVCNIGLFNNVNDFWIDSINGLLKKYPILEYPHINTFFTVLLIEKGTGGITIDQEKLYIDNAQIIFIKPNCITKLYLNTEATGHIICFTDNFFSLRYNTNVLEQFSFLNQELGISIRLTNEKLLPFYQITMDILDEFSNKKRFYKKSLRSYLNILLISLDRNYSPLSYVVVQNPMKDKIQKYQRLIEQHFKTHKMPSDYADMLNISTNYLNKICKKILNETSGHLIKRHIILEAQRLLNHTTQSISEISNELGFEYPSYFITTFKKITNQTPEQYRKKSLRD